MGLCITVKPDEPLKIGEAIIRILPHPARGNQYRVVIVAPSGVIVTRSKFLGPEEGGTYGNE